MVGAIILVGAWLSLFVAILIGWVLNLISIIGIVTAGVTGSEVELLFKVAGVFIAPVGAIFGYFW